MIAAFFAGVAVGSASSTLLYWLAWRRQRRWLENDSAAGAPFLGDRKALRTALDGR